MNNIKQKEKYYVYILRCESDRLYTGITNDVEKRFLKHKGVIKGGAKFTKAFKPKKIERVWKVKNKSEALKMEYYIKKLPKPEKERLIKSNRFYIVNTQITRSAINNVKKP